MRKVVLGRDSPILDRETPPGVAGFSCLSDTSLIFGTVYYAEGLNNPTVVVCHGFPSIDKNNDIAFILRQAGFNVVIFSYRGAWGSGGGFSFYGAVEDTINILHHIAQKKTDLTSRFDSERIILMGHSMGVFVALKAAAAFKNVRDIALCAAWNIGADATLMTRNAEDRTRVDFILGGAGRLAGASRSSLLNEMLQHADDYDLRRDVPSLCGRNVLLVGASEDVLTPINLHHNVLASEMRKYKECLLTEKILPCDHVFTSKRNALYRVILKWLEACGY
ncbi:hypothetical protein FACS1894187_10990 [Synergistales bacterium]|nr:hypothetical protein FACS1894187_10990 [Synergistales bacterium]